jgi:hypothetical protein
MQEKFGLETSGPERFLGGTSNNKMSPKSISGEVYFDAHEGDDTDNEYYDDSSSPDDYSIHMADEMADDIILPIEDIMISSDDNPSIETCVQNGIDPNTVLIFKPRKKLPNPVISMENVSFLGILRDNIGKDLSRISMPIALNEPINLLQKLCEDLQYSELLEMAGNTTNEVDRICLVAAFVVSGYSSTIHRAARKPFNPLIGETFEFDSPKGFRYISEKVSHQPPIMAMHAESKSFIYFQDSLMRTAFWGKSMELVIFYLYQNNTGTSQLKFPGLNDHYTWTRLTTSMRNVFSNARFLEHHGTTKIKSHISGHYCVLTFKESGYFTTGNNAIIGDVFNSSGKKLISLWYLYIS